MKASELRIGNYLQWNNFTEARIMNGKDFSIVYDSLENSDGCIEPIPLTDEWLLRFGFEKIGGTIYKNIGSIEIGFIGKRFYIQVGIENRNIKNIQHVHQLQNLYFALTGEELTLIEKP